MYLIVMMIFNLFVFVLGVVEFLDFGGVRFVDSGFFVVIGFCFLSLVLGLLGVGVIVCWGYMVLGLGEWVVCGFESLFFGGVFVGGFVGVCRVFFFGGILWVLF